MPGILQLKVFLTTNNRYDNFGMYRRIQVMDNISFFELHCILQVAVGWEGIGLHEFKDLFIPDLVICDNYDYPEGAHGSVFDSQGYKIKGYLRHNSLTYYEYRDENDFPWLHIIFVEDVLEKEKDKKYPICLEGKRNWPPQNNEGWEGYHALVAAMKKRKGKIYQDYMSLFQTPYDPEYCNLAEINDKLLNWRKYARDLDSIINCSH
ncbi:MAG: plasmid pRiA4b ORF-3 family protein [Chloroflexia bacterium]|nr:plasmid pRiA4b ORF-3 family protein [Chloroflexia bacterium]